MTGSWDRTVRFWDPRAANAEQSTHKLPERVYQMDLVNNILVVAMASRLFHIYDVRKMDSPAQTRESSLKFMTRALACMADGQGMFSTCLFVTGAGSRGSWQGMRRARLREGLQSSISIPVLKRRRRSTRSSAIDRR